MAVYERTYKRYTGNITPQRSRFLVLPKYAFRDVFKSKLMVGFYALCFVSTIILTAQIYLLHNLDFLELFEISSSSVTQILEVDADFFENFMIGQQWMAFFLTLFIGPGLVSRDLANNGLPLYLSRPFSRTEYVLGKISILVLLLSSVTWIPGLWLFGLHGNYEGGGWIAGNLRLAAAVVVGSLLWILILALMSLALSAWVRWRPIAAFAMFLIIVVGHPFAGIFKVLFHSDWGHLVNLSRLISIVWSALLGTEAPNGPPIFAAWVALAAFCAFCLFLLHRKIRAYEVVS